MAEIKEVRTHFNNWEGETIWINPAGCSVIQGFHNSVIVVICSLSSPGTSRVVRIVLDRSDCGYGPGQ
jgi:hypothetical protein